MQWHIIRWNPKKEDWDNIQKDINSFNINGRLIKGWELGGQSNIKEGNGFFMVRQGLDPKGIMGWGKIKGLRKIAPNKTYGELEFDMLLYPEKREMLTREYLNYLFPYVYWDTPKTGSYIDEETASLIIDEHNQCVKSTYK